MTKGGHGPLWQETGWDGLAFQLPATWEPTVIHPAYLLYELEGQPVFEIKWQAVRGSFSAARTLKRMGGSFGAGAKVSSRDLPPELIRLAPAFSLSGFQISWGEALANGLLLYCASCRRAILAQWHSSPDQQAEPQAQFLRTLRDHGDTPDRLWAVYDIRAWLPAEAKLTSHEFLPGRYTLHFSYHGNGLTLYRFKPAAVLLERESLGEFGRKMLAVPPVEEENGQALWAVKARGLDLLLARLRRQPAEKWMRLWHEPEGNVILGVKAEGKGTAAASWLERICSGYTSIPSP